MRLLYVLVFLLLTSVVYGQKTTLFQNINDRAKELKHSLNKSGDTLIFKCERTIFEAVIFNKDFERVIRIRDKEAKIPIADVPVGRYIVEILLRDKLIVVTLIRDKPFDLPKTLSLITNNSDLFGTIKPINKGILANVEEEKKEEHKEFLNNEKNANKTDLAVAGKKAQPKGPKKLVKRSRMSLLNTKTKVAKKTTKRPARNVEAVRTYWVEYKINNGQSSQKTQKLGDQEDVDRMIKKIKIDMKTRSGRLNELIVWTVYDTSKFAEHKRLNKDDFIQIPSDSFKMEPYYKKVNSLSSL